MKKHIVFALTLTIFANHLFSEQNEQPSEMTKDETEYRAIGMAGIFTGKKEYFNNKLSTKSN